MSSMLNGIRGVFHDAAQCNTFNFFFFFYIGNMSGYEFLQYSWI